MSGKMLNKNGMTDSIKSEHRSNAIRKRNGLTKYAVCGCICGCPARSCGAFYITRKDVLIPTTEECVKLLAADNARRKPPKKLAR